jgi:2-polyprenyl-3-methyl-5-hydroxy-6-metoxy-1,4-benzoquinol methylase
MKSTHKTIEVQDHLVSGEIFSVHFDSSGNLGRTIVRDDLNLSEYYPDDDYVSHQEQPKGLKGILYAIAQKLMLRYKLKVLLKHSKQKKLLDIGGGIGVFANFLKTKGYNVSLTEPNLKARQLVEKKGIKSYANIDDLPLKETYSILTLWHVLEHISDLDSTLEKHSNLLKNNGLLIIAVPNIASFDAGYYGPYWAAYDVPRHLWHFKPEGLVHKLKAHGFGLLKTYPLWFDSFYISILSETYAKRKLPFLRGLVIGLYSNLKALLTKEYSSKIYVFQKLN